jgi:glycogen debranching enzyme
MLAAYGRDDTTIARGRELLTGLTLHLGEACLGTISEMFEAEPPFRPVGAPAQAWSVGEVFHLLETDLRETAGSRLPAPKPTAARARTDAAPGSP